MTFFFWIIQKIAPVTNIVGILVLLSGIGYGDPVIEPYIFIFAGLLALIGFILGFTNWALDVPPRFFWTKSRVDLFDNRIGNAFGYAVIFFLLPFFVVGVVMLAGKIMT